MSDDGCQGASDIYEEATDALHASCSSEQQTQGLDKQTTPKTTQPVDEHKSDDDKHDEQPDKQSYKPRPFEDPRGYQGKEEDAGWLEQHEKTMRGPGDLRYKDFRYTTMRTS